MLTQNPLRKRLKMRLSRRDPALPGRPKGPIIISRDERDILFTRVALRLNGIDAVRIATENEDWDRAAVLGQEFSDLLALLCTDLGWGPGTRTKFKLRTSPEVLVRAVQAVEREAQADREIYEQDLLNAQEVVREAGTLLDTCRRIRGALSRV